ncbi:MAG: MerR family transcriptional regulator [Myxococcota bacterium]
MSRTVSEVAALAGVTVRALHHYDEIGLLHPRERTDAGYRLYDDADLARLHDILLWRGLGFPLDEVRALLDDPAHDPLEAMRLHRERLAAEVGALSERIAALDAAIARAGASEPLSHDDLVALFDGFDPDDYAEEVEQRWGDTEPYRESRRRTKRYGKAEWTAIQAEVAAVNEQFVALLAEGAPADGAEARAAAEAHRAHISRWFYEVTPEMHVGLAEMYVADPRFAATYDGMAPGLAAFVRAAILALHAPRPRRL